MGQEKNNNIMKTDILDKMFVIYNFIETIKEIESVDVTQKFKYLILSAKQLLKFASFQNKTTSYNNIFKKIKIIEFKHNFISSIIIFFQKNQNFMIR